jgi:hypothetical protein
MLAAWWHQLDAAGGIDLTLSGATPLEDTDNDLNVDGVGAEGNGAGSWLAVFSIANGDTVETVGGFGSVTVVTDQQQ